MDQQSSLFHLLNLLVKGTAFSEILYTFGRYYVPPNLFIVDFNIILAADLNGVYNEMLKCVKRPADRDILSEIEAIH